MNDLIFEEKVKIESLIYEVRGKQVMLDSDLARLYECANGTKDVNKAVKRNIERFPKDFYFQLTKEEYDNLKFQNGTSSLNNNYGGVRKLPYVFTEQGACISIENGYCLTNERCYYACICDDAPLYWHK